MNGQQLTPGSNVTTSGTITMATGMQSMSELQLPTPPQAHQHASPPSIPPPPLALHQQVITMPSQLLQQQQSSGSSSPGLQGSGLSPARHSPSPHSPARHSPSPHSPGSPATMALMYPGGTPLPLPLTVGHTSPIGKHGGTLGALTASVNALQRPISTAGLHHPTTSSYPLVRTTLTPGSRPFRMSRSPKQKTIMTTKTPIFRSHSAGPTTTMTTTPGATMVVSTVPPGMVRPSPSTQAVRAQVHQDAQNAAQVQAHLLQMQQRQQIMSTGIPVTSPPPPLPSSSNISIPVSPTTGPLMRNPSPTQVQLSQAKLQQALASATAKYRRFHIGPMLSPISSPPPPMGLVAPSVQARNKAKSTPNPPAKSQTIKPAPHIPILPKQPMYHPPPNYVPIMAKPADMTTSHSAHAKHEKSKMAQQQKKSKPRSQFKPMQGHHSSEVRPNKKPTSALPTATVSATASVANKVTKVVTSTATKAAIRPEISVRPEIAVRPEASVRPEIAVRSEVSAGRSEITVMSNVVTITENGCRDKEVPTAIVRPQVLTHVIDGFIIEESKEPFPVAHGNDMGDAVPAASTDPSPHKPHSQSLQENGNNSHTQQEDIDNLLRCEFCNQMAPMRKFKRSRRFCSMSCAKRYNVGCSKKVGLFSPKQKNPERAKHQQKLQTKAKPLKGHRGKHGRLSFNVNQPWSARFSYTENKPWNDNVAPPAATEPSKPPQRQKSKPKLLARTDSTTSSSSSSSNSQSVSDETSSISAQDPSPAISEPDTGPPSDDPFDDVPSGPLTTSPDKWSVQDVYEFIKSLPSCESYADEFKRQEIDGQALLLLKEDHLMSAMNMKLGPALKIISRIETLRKDK